LAAGAGACALAVLVATCRVDQLTNAPPPVGTLMVSPAQIVDSAATGSAAPRTASFAVANSGEGTLSWAARLARDASWVTLDATTGTAPASLGISMNPAGLPLGAYRDTLVVSSDNAAGSPALIPIELRVRPCAVTAITLDHVIPDSLTLHDCGAPHQPGAFARLYSFTGAAGDSVSLVLSAPSLDPFLLLDSDNTTAPALAQNDNCGVLRDACLRYLLLRTAGTYVIEATSAGAAETGRYTLSVTGPHAPGPPAGLAQLRSDSTTAVPLGGATDQSTVVLRGVVSDPDAADTLRLQVEMRAVGTAFTGTPTATGDRVPNGGTAFVAVAGLVDNTGYHWQARSVDQTGRVGAWLSFGGNLETVPDFSAAIPQPPGPPTTLGQFQSDGSTVIPAGGTATSRSVVFRATVADPNLGDALRLEVEAEPVGTAFAGVASGSGPSVANGATATATIAGLSDNTAYHWQARAVDQTGRQSPWVSFGGNAETDADFRVAVAVAQLVFTGEPVNTAAGSLITPAVQVTAQDAQGSTVTSFSGTVTVGIGTNAGGGTLSGATAVAALNGVARFSNLSIDRAGAGYTLRATTTAFTSVSAPFTITPAAAAQVVFTVQPTTTVAATAITPAVQVTARDAFGNTATGFTGNVTVSLATNAGGGTLSGTTGVAAVNGVAVFSSLTINRTGSGYTLAATAAGLTGATSNGFDVTAAGAARLVFMVQPSTTAAGAVIAPAVQVTAQDAQGNTATGFGGSVTVAIGTNPGSGTLSGTATLAAVNGIAAFSTLSINKAGTGYSLAASAASVTGATSAAFNIVAGTASRLVFTVPPTSTTAGSVITPAVRVAAQDAFGNTVPGFTGNVTVALGANPSSGTLSGTATIAAVAGVATFGDLSLDRAGTGYTLTAAASGLTAAASGAFDISPAAANRLAFTVQPTSATAGTAITPAVQVTARDALGNTVTSFTGSVTVALGNNAGGGTLSGTTTTAAVSGVATFASLSIAKAGTGYTLTAAANGLTTASSAAFNVTSGAASQLVFTVQPTSVSAGAAITPAVQVTAQDALGNSATGFTGNVTVAIGANPGGGTLSGTTAAAAASGVATFPGLTINRAGAAYTLTAAASGLTTASSAAFNVTPGAASRLVFTVQPTNATAGATMTPPVQVAAQDVQGNAVPGFTGNVTVAIGSNPGSGTLSGTTTAAAVNGVATFANLSINKVGTGYALTAAATGLTTGASAAFTITPGAAAQLVFTAQPSGTTAGAAITPAVRVTAQDAQGNTATGFSGTVTVAIGANPGGGTLAGTTTGAAVGGVATFSDLSINHSGTGYTLAAQGGGLAPVTSAPFGITAGAATHLVFTGQPTATPAGTAITPPVQVTAEDALGNSALSFTGNVTVALAANPGGGTLSGTTAVAAASGVAAFSGLSIDKAGSGYALTAAATGLTTVTSTAFTISAGAATRLVFSVQPTNTVAGTAITPAVQVTAQDALGNTDPSFTGAVAVAIGTNPVGGTLSGSATVAALQGVATFSNLTINRTGTGYTLSASATSLSGAASATFNIVGGTATRLVFNVPPASTTAGSVITPAVQATAQDAQGNTATGFTGSVTVAIGTNPGGATLSGTKAVAAVAGVATFGDLSLDRSGVGYTLVASASGVTGVTSATFDVSAGAANRLVFTVQPSTTTAGSAITPAVQVTARDALGNTVTSFSGMVTVALGNNPGNGTLSGTTALAATSGVATFATLRIERMGTGYTLTAAATGLTTGSSAAFTVTPGAAAQLVFTGQPTNTTAGAVMTPAVQVTAEDAFGNTNPAFTGNVTVALGTNPGGGTLSGVTTVAAASGLATFSNLSINKAGTGYTLTAAATGLTTPSSTAFNVTPGTAARLVFSVQPTGTTAGLAITPAVQVTAQDAQENTATGFTGNVTVAIGTNPGAGTLSGSTTLTAVNGVATFSTLSINKVGTGYTLGASATGLTGATSTPFSITPGAAAQLVYTVQPSTTTAGAAITPAVQVTARDAQGNIATGFTGSVTVAIGVNPSGGTLSGTATVAAVNGVATFSTLSINKSGTGYTVTASATGLSGAASTPFSVTPGAATQLVFTVQPSTTTAGAAITPGVQITAQDAFGNTDPTFTAGVTVAIGTNPSSGTLSGTTTLAAASGVATFSTLSIDKAGGGYTIIAAATGLTTGSSAPFNISAGAAAQLVFTGQPTSTTAGAAITPAVEVTARDAQGNIATGFSGTVTVAIGANPGDGTLSGTATVAALNGVATFSSLSVNKVGSGYTLTASATGLPGGTSTPFTVTPGAAAQLVFAGQPTSTTAGAAITPAVEVTARDAQGNIATGFSGTVTVAIGANPGGGTLSGTTTVAAVNGVATFSTVSINKVGTGYTLTATVGGLPTASSAAFTITPGAAAQLVFTGEPTSTTAGAAITPAIEVTARDAQGNIATGFTGDVTVAIGANPSSGTLSGTTTLAAANGAATFSNLSVNKAGAGYTLTASVTGLSAATSNAFDVTPGAATQLVFSVQPTNSTAGATLTPAVQVAAQDAEGNTAPAFSGTVTMAIGTNPGGGTLSGTSVVAPVNGVATFSTLSIDKAGTGYTLTASASGLTGGPSSVFNITAGSVSATQSTVTAAPGSIAAGSATSTITVTAHDAAGNPIGDATVVLAATGSGNTLTQPASATDASGVATGTLSSNAVGQKTVSAAISGTAITQTATVTVTPGPATQLVFTVAPTNTTAGSTIAPPVQVTARDAHGNTATDFTGDVSVVIGTNAGGGTLGGTATVAAVAGVATFSNLSMDKAGTGYTLTASATALTAATSTGFDITPGAATQLVVTVQPTGTAAGAAITPAMEVTAEDAQGNIATAFTGEVTVAIGSNPGGGTLSGTSTVAAVNGVATFSTVSIDRVGSGYTLTAGATGLTGATSTAFDITPGVATLLTFTGQPTSTPFDSTIAPPVQVTARDALGNIATGFAGSVTAAIGHDASLLNNAKLSGTLTVAAVSGVATFADLSIDQIGNGYTLVVTATGPSGAESAPFDITLPPLP